MYTATVRYLRVHLTPLSIQGDLHASPAIMTKERANDDVNQNFWTPRTKDGLVYANKQT